jgi:hypothetical protein
LHSLGFILISAYVNKGESDTQIQHICIQLRDCMCSGGVAFELLFARCVEHLPLLEGLAIERLHVFRWSCIWVAFARCVEPFASFGGSSCFQAFLSFASGV